MPEQVTLPEVRISAHAWDQLERRRKLKESIFGRPVRFGEIVTEVIENAVSRVVMA